MMGNTERYTYTADYAPEEPEEEKQVLTPSEYIFFRQMEKSLKKFTLDTDVQKPLKTLYDNFCRLNHLFVILQHPWLADSGIIQKACAWYISFAKPTKTEARMLIETLNGFTASACCLTEWNLLINRTQEFFNVQEKELGRLLEYEKETGRKQKERMERPDAEGAACSTPPGDGEICRVLYPRMEELYKVMGRFIEREKAPFRCKMEGGGEDDASIRKDTDLHAGPL